MAKEQDPQGFTVKDKRAFREDGGVRETAAAAETAKGPDPATINVGNESPASGEKPPGTAEKIDFPSYILSYYTQGLVLLGEVPNPYTNKKEEDLESAHHIVDLLAMLQEKTKGNLTQEEDRLLDSVLYELRMKFMAKTNRIKI